MIDIEHVLRGAPHFDTFCSVDKLHGFVDNLRSDPRFAVEKLGTSACGQAIDHVRFGKGRVKALFVGFPHPMEPIGGLTVFSLMALLSEGNVALVDADVEWNIIPCIDPDGARLNEAWTQDFTIENFLRNYYLQSAKDQADMSFPIKYKKLVANDPSPEAMVLKKAIDRVLPDFYCILHNTRFGGAFYLCSHDMGPAYHYRLHELLNRLNFPLQKRAPWKEVGERYADGIGEILFTRKIYDYLEKVIPAPETYELIRYGAESWDYIKEIRPQALTFVAEMGCLKHPHEESEVLTPHNLRRLKLRVDADSKYLATVLLDVWDKVRHQLDPESPFYRSILGGTVLPKREDLASGGWPMARYPTADILSNPAYDRLATQADVLNVCVVDSGMYFVQWAYQFVRLLRSSPLTQTVQGAIARAEVAFDQVRAEIGRYVDVDVFEVVALDTLAKVQLGSGLIALNSVLDLKAG